MIHGSKKTKKEKTPEQLKNEEDLSNKVNAKLADFFSISRKQIKEDQVEKYMEFTAILMQLCSDIPSIFNFRRELLKFAVEKKVEPEQKAAVFNTEINLTSKLIKSDPKSYTIWSYRQWLVLLLYKINPAIVTAEKALCKNLLEKDSKNFHVWNYRNWINSIQIKIDEELLFTSQKISSNPFNFSPYHFRSKLIIEKYTKQLQINNDEKERIQIINYGMPKAFFEAEMQKIRTAIFLNCNEQAPWIYYNWILNQLIPAFIISEEKLETGLQVQFNMKVSDFRKLIQSNGEFTLKGFSGKMNSQKWIIVTNSNIKIHSNLEKYSHVRLESTGKRFLGHNSNPENVAFIKDIYRSEIKFLGQVLQSQQNKCRFAWIQLLQLQKAFILCGTTANEWDQIISQSLIYLQNLKNEQKGQKYIQKQKEYWVRLSNADLLTHHERKLKHFYD